jgi:hypothetical protein
MRYPGDMDAGPAPGGQERLPGRAGGPWPSAGDDAQPGHGQTGAGWYPASDAAAGWPEGGELPGGWYGSGDSAGDRDPGDQPGGWYSDSGYSDSGYTDAAYGYSDGGLGGQPAGDPAAGHPADATMADVTTAESATPSRESGGTRGAAGTWPGGPAAEGDRVPAASGAAQPGSIPPGSAFYGAAGGTAGKGPVRGFPPAPGQPGPVYPPGQFSAWNRAPGGAMAGRAGRTAWPTAVTAEHGYAEPDYAVLAVSDPAADATATQTWAVADDRPAGGWQDMNARTGLAPSPARAPADRPSDKQDRRAMAPAGPGQADPRGGTRPAPAPPGRPGAAQPGGPAPRAARGAAHGRRGRKRARRGRVLLAAGLAVVVAVGTGTYFYLSGRQRPVSDTAAPGVTPAATVGQPSPSPTGRWGHIQTRKTDPQKLTLHQLFPVRFKSSGSTYSRTAIKAGKHCASAVIGSRLQAAVIAGKCSQVMRASYLSGNKKLMGTIGVLNLRSARTARHAGEAAGPSQFIEQLRGTKGPTRRLNKGTGIEEAQVKGHYLILMWAEFANLHAPKTKAQRKVLVQFCTRLLNNTANVSLSRRLVTGKP